MSIMFNDIISKVTAVPTKTVAVACAEDAPVLEAVKAAKEKKIANAILTGDEDKIRAIAAEIGFDLSDTRIIDKKDNFEAALAAVKLVHDGEADMYMKGLLPTGKFLKSVLDKEVGLRTGKPLSHVCVFEIPGIDRLLFLTDVAFIPYPTLEDKKCMIEYTVDVAKSCGITDNKVAVLAALETVNEKMPCTVEAAELSKMQDAGEIKDCVVEGPLSMDIALYREAAEEKGALGRKVAGDANILVFPDIHAGNLVYKTMVHMIDCKNGNILTGTKAPVILTSRSDTMEVKLNSIALAAVVADSLK
ncbi:MAG: phosphate butyryltransferase [Lachnospiraceae bacterium]|nr:phosphate butyryltransferase [Lachnospiraceae bacterium]